MATGDIKNNIKQLQQELKAAKYPEAIDVDGLVKGSPKTYLAFYHYLFTSYSSKLNKDIVNSNNELYGKSDMRFMEAVYKILRDMFDYKPHIHREQFFTDGFAERKLIMAADIVRLVRNKYKPPKSSSFKITTAKEEPAISQKVVQEPIEPTRKIASKSQDLAGAVVLPVNTSPGSSKIPKNVLRGHNTSFSNSSLDNYIYQRKSHSELPAPSSYNMDEKAKQITNFDANKIPSQHNVEQTIDAESISYTVAKKVMDSMNPVLKMLTERVEKIEIFVQPSQKLKQQHTASCNGEDSALSDGQNAALTKLMNDLIFKLDTLSSRIVLIENRLMLLESKIDNETNKTISNKSAHLDSKKPPVCPPLKKIIMNSSATVSQKVHSDAGNELYFSYDRKKDDGEASDEDCDVKDEEVGSCKCDVPSTIKYNSKTSADEYRSQANVTDDLEEPPIYMKKDTQQVNKLSTEKTLNPKPFLPVSNPNSSLFESFSSTIQADDFNSSWLMDQSSASQFDSQQERRASTPTPLTLDTSTLQKVNRIHQLMAETQKLFS